MIADVGPDGRRGASRVGVPKAGARPLRGVHVVTTVNVGTDPDPGVLELVLSEPYVVLGHEVVGQSFIDRDSVLETGDLESYTSVRRPEPGVWEIHDSNRGDRHLGLQTNDPRAVMLTLLSGSLAFERRVVDLSAPQGVDFEDDRSSVVVRWGTGSWATFPGRTHFAAPLGLGHLVAASDEAIVRSVGSDDGSPLFRVGVTYNEVGQEVGFDLRHFDLAHWREWLAGHREKLHERGFFGYIDGVEVPFLNVGRAGFGASVDYVSARRADVPEGTLEVSGDRPTPAGLVLVPLTAVQRLARWTWTAAYEGSECIVAHVRDGRLLIATPDSRLVWGDEWEGNHHDGWQRWIDIEGLKVTAHEHPINPGGSTAVGS